MLRGDTHDYYILVLVSVEQKSATMAGFVSRHEVMAISEKTLDLKKGHFIPNTNVALDADNHARHRDSLHNAEDDLVGMIKNAC